MKRRGLSAAAMSLFAISGVFLAGVPRAGAQGSGTPATAGAGERRPLANGASGAGGASATSGASATNGATGMGGQAAAGAGSVPGAPASPFPPVDPRNFTATSPSVETVNSFLYALWGFDENRTWSVAAIQPTQAPGVVAVHVTVAAKGQSSRLAQTTLFITPDGKYAIAGEVIRFGAQPFAETRALLAKRADGPSRGAADKALELVEFTDLDCTACKTAAATMDGLQQQFPGAHVVVEDMPLTRAHPFAYRAATVGYCVRQAKGDAGYMTYAQSVMANGADLTAEKADATLSAAARAAGADPAAALACSGSPAAKAAVEAVVQLGNEVGVNDVPTLFVNGRALPLAQVPVPVLGRIVVFQGKLDGLTVQQQPSLSTLK